MATNERARWFMTIIGFLVITLKLSRSFSVYGEPQVPCLFIFGDSLLDNGNNNNLLTGAKVNYPPYGIDFPVGPTGRFTNGRTAADVLAELLGFEFPIPPFASTVGPAILGGLNYASGSAGIRSETGTQLGVNVNFDRQILNHQNSVLRIAGILSPLGALNHLTQCLYFVGIGNNDYLNNYFQPNFFNTSREFTLEQFAQVLMEQYSRQIMSLYNLGARKLALLGVADIGGGGASAGFNQKLVSLVDKLNADLTDSKFIYLNISALTSSTYSGFKVSDKACCDVAATGLCKPFSAPCENRSEYAVFDNYHPTEAANIVSAGKMYKSEDPRIAYPMDISNLVKLTLL